MHASKTLKLMADTAGRPVEELEEVVKTYPFALTPFIRKRIEDKTYSLEALKQFLPDAQELQNVEGFSSDPVGESEQHPTSAIVQVYNNRLVIILSYQCLVYCRFCFRKALVGKPEHIIKEEEINKALQYVTDHPEIEEVLLSGGDPLAVPNRKLLPFLQKLVAIPHVKVIRIDSRAVSTMPERIDGDLLAFFKEHDRFWYHAHMNHPDDINHPAVITAIQQLRLAGVPVLNQSVILKGVNDAASTMTQLMKLCYQNRVIPYNLYVLDRVKGAAHFDVPTDRIVEICKALSHLPGPAQPALVYVDAHGRKHRTVYDEDADLRAFIKARNAFSPTVAAEVNNQGIMVSL